MEVMHFTLKYTYPKFYIKYIKWWLCYRRSNMVFLATFVWENGVVGTKALQETKALQPTTRKGCGQPLAVAATLTVVGANPHVPTYSRFHSTTVRKTQ
jgi:hypothetical protein